MSRYLFGCAIASTLAIAISVAAQEPRPGQQAQPATPQAQTPSPQQPSSPRIPPPAPTPTAQAPAAPDQAAAVTVEGCLARAQDIPGRKANVAERAGLTEDFILMNTKMVKGSAPTSSVAEAKPGEAPVGTSGSSAMYDVKGLESDRLKSMVGQRVQIEGKFEDLERSASAKPGEDLVNIKGITIVKVPGECAK